MTSGHTAMRALVRRIRGRARKSLPGCGSGRACADAQVVMVLLTFGPADGGATMTNRALAYQELGPDGGEPARDHARGRFA